MSGAWIDADCNLCDHTYVERGAVVGDRATISHKREKLTGAKRGPTRH
jgi:hypothetical protein